MNEIHSAHFKDALLELEKRFSQRQRTDLAGLATVIGYGEISCVLCFNAFPNWVVKRLPIFETYEQAQQYQQHFREYNRNMNRIGLAPVEGDDCIIEYNGQAVFYVVQPMQPAHILGVETLRRANQHERSDVLHRIFTEIDKVFQANADSSDLALSLDGQLSNWAITQTTVLLLDNGTPLMRKNGVEQLNYELLLSSTPGFLRGVLRRFFLQDVLDRYYDRTLVYTDFIANLYKEGLSDLVPLAIKQANERLNQPLDEQAIRRYYREDKLIWQLFLGFRKIDRWLQRNVRRQPYQYLLPDKVSR